MKLKHTLFSIMAVAALGYSELSAQTRHGFETGENGDARDTYIGHHSGEKTGKSQYNTFVGGNSGRYRKENGNTAVGAHAGQGSETSPSQNTGKHNVFVGVRAGVITTSGSANVYVGNRTGETSTTAEKNIFVGNRAGGDANGSRNVYIGNRAGESNIAGERNVYIGNNTGQTATGSDRLYIDNSNTPEPLLLGNFDNNDENLRVNGYLSIRDIPNQPNFTRVLVVDPANNNIVSWRDFPTPVLDTITCRACLKYGCDESKGNLIQCNKLFPRSNFFIDNSNDAPNPLVWGDFDKDLVRMNGTLEVTVDARKPNGGPWNGLSDRRLKQDIKPFTEGLEVLQKIKPVRFRYNGKAGTATEEEHVGIIAQDMQKIAPYTIGSFTYKDENDKETDYLEYNGNAVSYIVINAVKEQQQLIESQQKELEAQRKEIAGLKEMVYGLVSASKKASDTDKLHASAGEE